MLALSYDSAGRSQRNASEGFEEALTKKASFRLDPSRFVFSGWGPTIGDVEVELGLEFELLSRIRIEKTIR